MFQTNIPISSPSTSYTIHTVHIVLLPSSRSCNSPLPSGPLKLVFFYHNLFPPCISRVFPLCCILPCHYSMTYSTIICANVLFL
jgi:hypothetical protein